MGNILASLQNLQNTKPSTYSSTDKTQGLQQAEEFRDKAEALYEKSQQFSKQSQQAYQNDEKELAKTLSNQKKECIDEAESYNHKAKEIIFYHQNKDRPMNEIDLHLLYVKEALEVTEQRIQECIQQNVSELTVITGRGNHSVDNKAKIRPEVISYAESHGIHYSLNDRNPGIVIYHLGNVKPVSPLWKIMSTILKWFCHSK